MDWECKRNFGALIHVYQQDVNTSSSMIKTQVIVKFKKGPHLRHGNSFSPEIIIVLVNKLSNNCNGSR